MPFPPASWGTVLSSAFLASPSLWCLSLVHVTSTCLRLSSFSLYPNLSPVPRHTQDFLISLVYLDKIPSWTNIFIYYVFASWINIFIYYSFASLSISFHLNVNSTGSRFIVHLFPEASQSLRPAIDKYQGMNKYFLNELMKTDILMSTRDSCLIPPRHLQCPVPQIEFLTYPLPLHRRCTENFSALANVLVNHTEVLVRNSNEILHLPPPPSQPTFVLFCLIFQTWPLFKLPFKPLPFSLSSPFHLPLVSRGTESASSLASCLQFPPLPPIFHSMDRACF